MITGIDLGSNTLRAVTLNEALEPIQEAEFVIGAAKNLSIDENISQEAIERLRLALKSLKTQGFKLDEAEAVATAAFRKAKNTKEIFTQIQDEFGLSFKCIDALSEARLSILGMQNALKRVGFKQNNLAFCDLGGASCELSFANNLKSFDFGIISFYEKARSKPLSSHLSYKLSLKTRDKKLLLQSLGLNKRLLKLAFMAFDEVELAKKHLKKFKGRVVVLNSGVPTTLSALKQGIEYERYKASLINGKTLRNDDFLKFGIKLWYMSEKEACKWVGENRKNYLVAGCFLLFALFDKQKLIVVDEGLREGVCIDKLLKLSNPF